MTGLDVPAAQAPHQTLPEATQAWQPPSLLAYPATYLLIGTNVAIFLAMCRFGSWPGAGEAGSGGAGVSTLARVIVQVFTAPFSDRTLTIFGSCLPMQVVAHGQWWRLVTSIFVHVTLLHLLLNMWCLWNLGLFGEPLLGRPGLVAVYVLTGAAGMLQSVVVSWLVGPHDLLVAGASGAVFGLAGVLIVLLSNRRLGTSWQELRSLRRQVIFFALANLVLGLIPDLLLRFAPRLLHHLFFDPADVPLIDNNAHLGGLLCGLLVGFLLYPRLTSGRSTYRSRQAFVFTGVALLLMLLGYAFANFAHVANA